MHVVVNRSVLVEALGAASSVVAARTPKDVLKCVKLATVDQALLISATDLEIGLRVLIRQVEIQQPGEALVPVDKLMSIARESVDDTLTLESDTDKCHIRGQDSHFEIYTQNPQEFPPVSDLEGQPDVEIAADVLHGLIDQTIFAVAKENTRYAINGVLWEKTGKKLSMVATDGRRLAWTLGSTENASGEDKRAIVPVKMVSVLQRILPNVDGPVAIQLTENQLLVRGGAYVITSALVEGHFPQYQEVIPRDCDRKVELVTDELLSAVRRAALLTNEQSKGIRLRFADGKLVLSSRAPEQGEATISMAIEYSDVPMEIGFSPVFVADALRVARTKTVTLELKDAERPGVLKNGEGFVYVVMPVSLV